MQIRNCSVKLWNNKKRLKWGRKNTKNSNYTTENHKKDDTLETAVDHMAETRPVLMVVNMIINDINKGYVIKRALSLWARYGWKRREQ